MADVGPSAPPWAILRPLMALTTSAPPGDLFQLLDRKRSGAALYAMARGHKDPAEAWSLWRAQRAALFSQHPQSPLPSDRRAVAILEYFAYNPSCVYDPSWACPLAPPANRLPVSVEGGEQLPGGLFATEEDL